MPKIAIQESMLTAIAFAVILSTTGCGKSVDVANPDSPGCTPNSSLYTSVTMLQISSNTSPADAVYAKTWIRRVDDCSYVTNPVVEINDVLIPVDALSGNAYMLWSPPFTAESELRLRITEDRESIYERTIRPAAISREMINGETTREIRVAPNADVTATWSIAGEARKHVIHWAEEWNSPASWDEDGAVVLGSDARSVILKAPSEPGRYEIKVAALSGDPMLDFRQECDPWAETSQVQPDCDRRRFMTFSSTKWVVEVRNES